MQAQIMSHNGKKSSPKLSERLFRWKNGALLLPRNFAQLKFYDGSNLRLQTENKIACFSNSIVKGLDMYLRHSRRSECTSSPQYLLPILLLLLLSTDYVGTTASKQSKCFEERRIETGSYVTLSEKIGSVEESVE